MPSYWEPITTDKRPWQPIAVVRYFYLIRLTIQLVCIALSLYGIFTIVRLSNSIPRVLVSSETGRVVEGRPKEFEMSATNVEPLITDVLTALYTRTEKGRVIGELSDFVDPVIVRTIDMPFTNQNTPFSISMLVTDVKFRFVRMSVMQVSFKTLISYHMEGSYQSSIVYFDTRWDRDPKEANPNNPLGWRLTGIVTSTENLFNKEEILEEIKRNTVVSDTSMPITSDQASQPKATATPAIGSTNTISVPDLGE